MFLGADGPKWAGWCPAYLNMVSPLSATFAIGRGVYLWFRGMYEIPSIFAVMLCHALVQFVVWWDFWKMHPVWLLFQGLLYKFYNSCTYTLCSRPQQAMAFRQSVFASKKTDLARSHCKVRVLAIGSFTWVAVFCWEHRDSQADHDCRWWAKTLRRGVASNHSPASIAFVSDCALPLFARHLKGFDSYSRRCRFKLCSTLRCFLQKIWTWKNEESCSLLGSGKREEAHAKSVVRNEVWVGWRAGANVHHCNQQECRGTIRRDCNRKIMGSRTNNMNFCFKMKYSSHMAMLTGGMMIKHAIFGYLISDKPI